MSSMDIFNNDAFHTRELSDAVNMIPNQWGRIGELGIFKPKGIRTAQFMIESKNGVLQLIQSSERGTDMPGQKRPKRAMRGFSTLRFGLEGRITADDISGIRAFGSDSELKQVLSEVGDKQEELRGSTDITREYLRAGALQGIVKEADGTEIVNLFDEFGIAQKVVDLQFGTAAGLDEKCEEVVDHINLSMMGDVTSGVRALCTSTAWAGLMRNEGFREAFKYYESVSSPLRKNVSGGFEWKGIFWEKYLATGAVPQEDGTIIQRSFVPEGDVRFFPMGTRQTFKEYNSPADYMEVVNTPGRDFYSKVMPDPKANRWVDVEVQMNTLPMCLRPGALVRGWSSN